ncbi:hypothetical protein DFH07DRAFT_777125 [Mycena maculata]|uniref:Uncharacterized protein n=1 Tax=Mycena maculata TaxID=230809 RepID=A0AAD7IIZ6_9AGAR|nr:hypothetical protein DFH07DRAFT_777125 [Mycena maculata]
MFDTIETVFEDFPSFSWSTPGLLPILTHLVVYTIHSLTVTTEILAHCEQLEALADVALYPFIFNDFRVINDASFVAATWEGPDFWARADTFVTKQQRGEIEPVTLRFLLLDTAGG